MVSVDIFEWKPWGVGFLVLGLCLVLVAGVGIYTSNQTEYEYFTEEEEVRIHDFSDLDTNEKALFQDALDESGYPREATGPVPSQFSHDKYIIHDGTLYEIQVDEMVRGPENVSIEVFNQTTVQEYKDLSETAQKAVRELDSGKNEVVMGTLAPEFDVNGPDHNFGHGKYVVEYENELHIVYINSEGSPFGRAIVGMIYFSIGLLGIVCGTVGTLITYRYTSHPALAIVASLVTWIAVLRYTNLKLTGIGVSCLGAFVGVWALLYRKDVTRGEN
jgi:hypothetical protein